MHDFFRCYVVMGAMFWKHKRLGKNSEDFRWGFVWHFDSVALHGLLSWISLKTILLCCCNFKVYIKRYKGEHFFMEGHHSFLVVFRTMSCNVEHDTLRINLLVFFFKKAFCFLLLFP